MEGEDHSAAIGMPVNSVAPLAAAMDEARLEQKKFRFVESEGAILIARHQFFQKLFSLAHVKDNARFRVRGQ